MRLLGLEDGEVDKDFDKHRFLRDVISTVNTDIIINQLYRDHLEKLYSQGEREQALEGYRKFVDRLMGSYETEETRSSNESAHLAENFKKHIDNLELSVRAYNGLKNARIYSIEDIVQNTEADLLKLKNFGRKSLKEIKEVLGEMGLSLGMELPEKKGK